MSRDARGRLSLPMFADHWCHCFASLAKAPRICFNDESRVTFFLPGNDVIDDHRASSGDSFLDRSATGFTNEQMISAKQTRHLIGPTENIDFAVARRFL